MVLGWHTPEFSVRKHLRNVPLAGCKADILHEKNARKKEEITTTRGAMLQRVIVAARVDFGQKCSDIGVP